MTEEADETSPDMSRGTLKALQNYLPTSNRRPPILNAAEAIDDVIDEVKEVGYGNILVVDVCSGMYLLELAKGLKLTGEWFLDEFELVTQSAERQI